MLYFCRMMYRISAVLLSIIILVGCAATKGKKLQKAGYISPGNHSVKLTDSPKDSVTLHYFNAGGFYIEYANEAILIDPFASNPSATGRIKRNPAAVDSLMQHATGLSKGRNTKVKAILATHAHYDHLMDVPYILDNWADSSTWFAGNNSATKMVQLLTTQSIGPLVNLDAGNGSLLAGNRFRVTPILLSHPPHIGNHKLYGGEFSSKAKPWNKNFWQCGQTYGFIIDAVDTQGFIKFRIYMQSSAGLLGLDNVPAGILHQRAVDLMILPAALYSKVKGYPQKLVSYYHPKHIVVCHWENFFKPIAKISQKPYAVGLTNVYKFAKQLDDNIGKNRFTIPMPDTKLSIKF